MKKTTRHRLGARLALALILVGAEVLCAAPDDRFHGGASDGAASAVYSGYSAPVGGDDARYAGGTSGFDGYAAATYTGYTRPAGGEEGRFVGGTGFDGYAATTYTGYTRPAGGEERRFVGGGGYDGYAAASFDGYSPPVGGSLGRFVGGAFDGADSDLVPGLTNPLAGDSDGDGVPDWWESSNYLSITLADAVTDIDGDGRGSLDEYLADTDPNDPLSRLAILNIELGIPVRIESGVTSPDRRYWVERSTDLSSGTWSAATSPTVPGNGAVLTLDVDDNLEVRTFYRIRVALPED